MQQPLFGYGETLQNQSNEKRWHNTIHLWKFIFKFILFLLRVSDNITCFGLRSMTHKMDRDIYVISGRQNDT